MDVNESIQRDIRSYLAKLNNTLTEINEKLDKLIESQGICPHGSTGFCMLCFGDQDIGWHIAQALKK